MIAAPFFGLSHAPVQGNPKVQSTARHARVAGEGYPGPHGWAPAGDGPPRGMGIVSRIFGHGKGARGVVFVCFPCVCVCVPTGGLTGARPEWCLSH